MKMLSMLALFFSCYGLRLNEVKDSNPTPSLYCLMLVVPNTDEVGLAHYQYRNQLGCFSCKRCLLASNVSKEELFRDYVDPQGRQSLLMQYDKEENKGRTYVQLDGDLYPITDAAGLTMSKSEVPDTGNFSTAQIDEHDMHRKKYYDLFCLGNSFGQTLAGGAQMADIMRKVWSAVEKEGLYQNYDWIVKVDPDNVFFPRRLEAVLQGHKYQKVVENREPFFLTNYAVISPQQETLMFNIQILTSTALDKFLVGRQKCWDNPVETWQMGSNFPHAWRHVLKTSCRESIENLMKLEDTFMEQCLRFGLHVSFMYEPRVQDEPQMKTLQEHKVPDCHTEHISFHPFKTLDKWKSCYQTATHNGALTW